MMAGPAAPDAGNDHGVFGTTKDLLGFEGNDGKRQGVIVHTGIQL